MFSSTSYGFDLFGLLSTVIYLVVVAFAVLLGILLVRTLLAVIRALGVWTRERELRIDLMLADDGPLPPSSAGSGTGGDPAGPTGPSAAPRD